MYARKWPLPVCVHSVGEGHTGIEEKENWVTPQTPITRNVPFRQPRNRVAIKLYILKNVRTEDSGAVVNTVFRMNQAMGIIAIEFLGWTQRD